MPDPTRDLPPHGDPTADPSSAGLTGDLTTGLTADPSATAATSSAAAPVVPGFELSEEVGRGGMGVVYRARDVAFGRDVAVKLLQDKYPADGVAARRFLDEARITGQLQHPGIPAAYQTGTLPDGRPFLAMKLIKGQTLDDLIKESSPDRGRLVAAFEGVCQAVGYAHAHGVIHRDLKPANVMVGAFGEVQVMDWGLAKVLADRRPDPADPDATAPATAFDDPRDAGDATRDGSVLGTPAYLPPEQAAGAVGRVDARSDVFGLGAVLCAVLTGRPPFVADSAAAARLLAARGKVADAYARLDGCGADPELVALCKRCLSPEQADRPADGGEVAAEVARLRAAADERVRRAELDRVRADGERAKAEAEAREQAKRRRAVAVAGGVVAAVLAAGAGVSIWQAVRATAAEGRTADQLAKTEQAEASAKAQAAKATAAAELAERREQETAEAAADAKAFGDFLENDFLAVTRPAGVQGGVGVDVKVSEALAKAEADIPRVFAGRPAAEARARHAVGVTWRNLAKYDRAEVNLTRALDLRRKHLGPEAFATFDSLNSLGVLYDGMGRPADAEPLLVEAVAVHRKALAAGQPTNPMCLVSLAQVYSGQGRHADAERLLGEVRPPTPESLYTLSDVYRAQGRLADAEALSRENLAFSRRVNGDAHPHTLGRASDLARVNYDQGRLGEAERLFDAVLVGSRKVLGADHPQTLDSLRDLARVYVARARYADAGPLFDEVLAGRRKVYGDAHRHTLGSISDLALLHQARGRDADAEPLARTVLAGLQKALGPDHPDTLAAAHNLARVYDARGRPADAERLFDEVLAGMQKVLGAGHPNTLRTAASLAAVYHDLGRPADAERLFDEALAGQRKALGAGHPNTLKTATGLASVYGERGRYADAERLLKDALAGQRKNFGDSHPETLTVLNNLAVVYGERRPAEAERLLREALAGKQKVLGPGHPRTLHTACNLASMYHNQGRYAEAERLDREVLAGQRKVLGDLHPDTLRTATGLAMTYHKLGRPADAERLFDEALAGRRKALGSDHPEALGTAQDLAALYWKMGRLDRSVPLFEDILGRQRKVLGEAHPKTLHTMANLGVNYKDAGRPAEAVPLLERAYAARDKHPDLAWVGTQLPDAYVRAGRRADAVRFVGELLAESRRLLPADGADFGDALVTAGSAFLDLGLPGRAEPILRECVAVRDKLPMPAWRKANIKSLLGEALLAQGKAAEAEPHLLAGYAGLTADRTAIPTNRQRLVPEAVDRLVRVYLALGKPDEAAKWRAERKKYPPDTAPRPRPVVCVAPPPREAGR